MDKKYGYKENVLLFSFHLVSNEFRIQNANSVFKPKQQVFFIYND